MSSEMVNILVPAIVGLVSSFITYLVSKNNNSKDLTINDRQQLSEDEKQFRAELRETILEYKRELSEYRDKIVELNGELYKARKEIRELNTEGRRLHEVNVELRIELTSLKNFSKQKEKERKNNLNN